MKVIGNSSKQETNKVDHERTLTMQKPKKTAQRRQPPGQQHWRECDNCGYQHIFHFGCQKGLRFCRCDVPNG